MFYYLFTFDLHNVDITSLSHAVRTRPGFILISVLFISSPVVGSWGKLWAVGSVYTMFHQAWFARWFLKYRSPIWRKQQNIEWICSNVYLTFSFMNHHLTHRAHEWHKTWDSSSQYVHCICFYSSLFMCHTHLVESNWHFRGIAFLETLWRFRPEMCKQAVVQCSDS